MSILIKSRALQSDQEAGTSTRKPVTPAVQQFHPSAAKCWAYVTVTTGTPSLDASYNITSITDVGVGQLTITIATDFSSAAWAPSANYQLSSGSVASTAAILRVNAQAAGSITLVTIDTGDTVRDPAGWSFHGFGDQ